MNLPDSTRRAIRTALDNIVGVLILLGVILPFFGDFIREVGGADSVTAYLAKAMVILTALVTLISRIKNMLEDRGVIPALFKAPASNGEDPVPDAGRHRA